MKLTLDKTLERLNEDRRVDRDEVPASVLRRKVWLAEWHVPGCMSEARSFCTTKAGAIEAALSYAEGQDGAPRGMASDLRRYGVSDRVAPDAWTRLAITSVRQHTLSDFI